MEIGKEFSTTKLGVLVYDRSTDSTPGSIVAVCVGLVEGISSKGCTGIKVEVGDAMGRDAIVGITSGATGSHADKKTMADKMKMNFPYTLKL